MQQQRNIYLANIDWIAFCSYLALITVGLIMIYTVGSGPEGYTRDWASFLTTPVGKQAIWIVLCLVVFIAITMLIDQKFWQTFSYLIYGLSLAGLVLVLILGTKIKGATSWFTFGGVAFQPSELAKFGTCLAMAAYLSHWNTNLERFKSMGIAFAIMLAPALLILLQPDAGSALVFISFLIVMYRQGLPPLLYVVGGFTATLLVLGIVARPEVLVAVLLAGSLLIYAINTDRHTGYWTGGAIALGITVYWAFTVLAWPWILGGLLLAFAIGSWQQVQRRRARLATFMSGLVIFGALLASGANYAFNEILKPHQQERLNVWLRHNEVDDLGAGYNVYYSKLSISAGGLLGKGLQNGTLTKLDYVPEQQTDFIFCAVGEEQGFVGAAAVIVFFFVLIWRLTVMAERQRTPFARVYCYGVAGILFIHVLVNIGMTMGLLPIIGIPLPFLSKGGSSLLGFTVMLAVALKFDRHRLRKVRRIPI